VGGIKLPLRPPEPLGKHHALNDFCSGVDSLDHWLKRKAAHNEASRASRTYVLCDGDKIVGYYALASGSVAASVAPRTLKRNMPDPIPVMVLGRLAIDQTRQRQGLGKALLRDAVLRVLQAADIAGIKAILVHALSEDAKRFYAGCGFLPFPGDDMTLALPLEKLR